MTATPFAARRAVVLFGHGSRDPLWCLPMEAVAARMSGRQPELAVRCAYLELTEPDLAGVVAEMAAGSVGSITVVPMFLGVGRHAREDLPRLIEQLRLQYPAVAFTLRRAIGEDERVLDLLARISLE
ncbi:MAG: CbiX/SirB N-terminal domain-containing protein [Ramlibacter sp.]